MQINLVVTWTENRNTNITRRIVQLNIILVPYSFPLKDVLKYPSLYSSHTHSTPASTIRDSLRYYKFVFQIYIVCLLGRLPFYHTNYITDLCLVFIRLNYVTYAKNVKVNDLNYLSNDCSSYKKISYNRCLIFWNH